MSSLKLLVLKYIFIIYSSPGYANAGPDYVDYGAYTGGYGAFGWYTDHPVLVHGSPAHH